MAESGVFDASSVFEMQCFCSPVCECEALRQLDVGVEVSESPSGPSHESVYEYAAGLLGESESVDGPLREPESSRGP